MCGIAAVRRRRMAAARCQRSQTLDSPARPQVRGGGDAVPGRLETGVPGAVPGGLARRTSRRKRERQRRMFGGQRACRVRRGCAASGRQRTHRVHPGALNAPLLA